MNAFSNWLDRLLGLNLQPEQLDFAQLAVRAIIIFVVALALMRLGHKRSLTRKSAFDMALVVIFGAILARAINGSGPFFPTIGAAFVLVALHRLLAFAAFRWPHFENLIKGRPDTLLRGGRPLRESMRRHDVSTSDLEEDMHLCGHNVLEEIEIARLERNGKISFIKKN